MPSQHSIFATGLNVSRAECPQGLKCNVNGRTRINNLLKLQCRRHVPALTLFTGELKFIRSFVFRTVHFVTSLYVHKSNDQFPIIFILLFSIKSSISSPFTRRYFINGYFCIIIEYRFFPSYRYYISNLTFVVNFSLQCIFQHLKNKKRSSSDW